ncbi:hypothetical protein FPZ12_023845 [Amycolatopsis acidicola]|uniref:Outer membrane channel protein CpnT-like N-terminal domain-containing protein n=1 Tax=Amycolatopsis acidicola TaxID=2596893 RepID=A0A5N0UX29_9PSEU|nr:hypothetical protein [Amycolatopsis acidicola]KAA9157926.1 hypothetical protein FPZ12_023845 [Amycolatopsis acidicola]
MATDNPLVNPSSQFDPDDYGPDPEKIAQGDLSTLNPITSGGDWWAGSGLWDDCNQLAKSIQDRDLVGVFFGTVAVELDAIGVLMDPIGTALSGLAGWMIEHLKPLRLMLDELAGNPDTIKGVAQTWTNISGRMKEVAQAQQDAVQQGTTHWQGPAADAYRKSAGKLYDAAGATSSLSEGMSSLIQAMGECVATVRSLVRDLIATLVAELVQDALEEAASIGFATPLVIEEATGAITRCTGRTVATIEKLVDVIGEVLDIATKINSLLQTIAKVIEDLPKATQAAG